jgi:polar amino acid transport system substrate-binding protein
MYRLIPACLLALACAGLAAAPLRMGGFTVAPLVMGEPGQPLRGALRDFLQREVAPQGVAMEWTPVTSVPEAIRNLSSGKIDILLVASGAAAREKGAAEFRWNYLVAQAHLAVTERSALRSVPSLERLSGLTIGWIAGPRISPGLARSGAIWDRPDVPDWQLMNLRRLQMGQIDAVYFENPYSPRYYARIAGMPIRLVRLPMPPRTFYMMYSQKSNAAAIARFDRAARVAFGGRRFHDFLERYTAGEGAQVP